jgi:hypothetical protein
MEDKNRHISTVRRSAAFHLTHQRNHEQVDGPVNLIQRIHCWFCVKPSSFKHLIMAEAMQDPIPLPKRLNQFFIRITFILIDMKTMHEKTHLSAILIFVLLT